jgi:hypothetical protein
VNVSVEIKGDLPQPLEGVVKEVLHRALDFRPQEFVVHISKPHAEVIVHVTQPIDKRLKFNGPMEVEIARELYAVITEIVDEELGPAKTA